MTKLTWPCPGKPEDLKGQPIGMYHCEFCGEMQLAGVSHVPPQEPSQWEEPFPKIEYPEGPDDEAGPPSTTCPSCGALDSVTFTREEERFPYGEGAARLPVELTAVVDKGRCSSCTFEFTDWRAEVARDEAVTAHLKSKA
jgi:hypothetical protein